MFFGKKLREAEEKIAALEREIARLTALARQTQEQQRQVGERLRQRQEENEVLRKENQSIKADTEVKLAKYSSLVDTESYLDEKRVELEAAERQLGELRKKYQESLEIFSQLEKQTDVYREDLEFGEIGLYQRNFDFDTSAKYKDAITKNYNEQKRWVKEDRAVICQTEWSIAGSRAEGKKMTDRFKKLMLFAFNGECDSLIAKVKWNNAEKTKERIQKAFDQINKLGETTTMLITGGFLDLKLEEMSLTYEYELKKYEEKEEQRALRDQMREEERAQREFEKAQREAEDEERRFEKALEKARAEIGKTGEESAELAERIRLLEDQLAEAHERKERALAMAQLTKVGHIYIVSNIGAFGEGVYKIGMTRRLDPLDRVKELGDASVPFQFDVHAIIYSENAPQLEAELHQRFSAQRMNLINQRKEFFKVNLSEVESFIRSKSDAEIEFTLIAEAKEYRETLGLLETVEDSDTTKRAARFPSELPS